MRPRMGPCRSRRSAYAFAPSPELHVRFDTLLVQAAQRPTNGTGDVVPPIHFAATYERTAQDPPRYFYGRGENPTREGLEECLAALEGASHATVFASGQAAASTA